MNIEQRIAYQFKQPKLLDEALTHPGCAESRNGVAYNYQRLEFLGDAVLGLVVAEMVYSLYPQENEGSLAKRHAALVRSESLAQIARSLALGEFMKVTSGAGAKGERENNSNLEDVCEALIGAMYLDGGLDAARAFIERHWAPLARNVQAAPKDAKTTLQEWAQGRGLPLPVYTVLSTTGPAHAPQFTVEVRLEVGGETATAEASNKRQAEQLAAAELLNKLHQAQ